LAFLHKATFKGEFFSFFVKNFLREKRWWNQRDQRNRWQNPR
jgi:hypothetical protein